jgi:Alkaline phosphatase PhoX
MRPVRHLALSTAFVMSAILTFAQSGIGPVTSAVPQARHRIAHPPTLIAPQYKLKEIVNGFAPLENPSGIITNFGFLNDFPPQPIEATKTEADENTYLVFNDNPGGPTEGYDYGRHFLFQGHEVFSGDIAYMTRINLDVTDPAHRITLLTPVGEDGLTHINDIDGSTYDPFTGTLLFTSEAGPPVGGVYELTTSWPPTVTKLDGILGSAGYEGIHPDDQGNLLIIEDSGGASVNVNPDDPNSPKNARQPNSFVYRFVPNDKADLSAGGKLQALQVSIDGEPVVFHADDPVGDVFSDAQLQLHTPGTSFPVQWVTVHDTAVDGTDPFNANSAAKAAGATPFKRPENAQFLPGSGFLTFFFDPTGDTNANSGNVPALAARGAWGSIFRVDLNSDREGGLISIFVLGDAKHSSFDNLTFADANTLLAAEDRGDTLHSQLNRLDSIWSFFVNGSPATRFVALGRDKLAEIDASLLGTPGYQNEGDNEPTGLHVSTGNTLASGIPGTLANLNHPRAFFTQQHGMNTVYEVVKKK